ncbi:MAG: translation initiation factor IF-5A [Candidatus Aenigmarchaeota archaeon]|nr:translation initiation factor IF-5A [Candidatus Aenigmarchaeota archaeon]
MKHLKQGSFVLIDDIPYRVDKLQVSKAGKHGAAKARILVSGLFDDSLKKTVVGPGDTKMDVPIIEKKNAQVIAMVGANVQLMDIDDYSMTEVPISEEFKGKLQEGDEVLLWKFGSYTMIKSKK